MMLCPTLVTRQKHLFLISVFFAFQSYICDIHCNFFFFSPGTVIATAYPFLKECQNVVKQVNLLTPISFSKNDYNNNYRYDRINYSKFILC